MDEANIVAWGIAPATGALGACHTDSTTARDGSVPDVFGVAIEGDVCIGPFWFAKAARVIDRNATRALLADTSFFADYATIAKVPERHVKLSASASNHVSEDIFMGYRASQIPQLNIVRWRSQRALTCTWVRGVRCEPVPAFGGEVLALHKFPYGCHEAAASVVAAAWGDGASRRPRPLPRIAVGVRSSASPGTLRSLLAHPGVERRLCAHAELETLPSAVDRVAHRVCLALRREGTDSSASAYCSPPRPRRRSRESIAGRRLMTVSAVHHPTP